MFLLREVALILIAVVIGVIAIVTVAFGALMAIGTNLGGWQMALGMLVIMSFWPLTGITATTRLICLARGRGDDGRYSIVAALALTAALLALLHLFEPLNPNRGTAAYVGLAFLGSAVSALALTQLNLALPRRVRR